MEFNFSINALFREKLVKVKNNLLPENHSSDRRGDGDVAAKVAAVLDKMGVVSAKAQSLPVAITSAAKLRNSDHIVYILTDPEGNKGHGTVVGILKVGCKKLFVYDLSGSQWEMEPLCVLDFYVYESKQRTGCGKLLFDYMLKDQRMNPQHLALDQPSDSFLTFMCKHYGLDNIIPQMNSFVVYDSFFVGRTDKGRGSSSHSSRQNNIQAVKAISRAGDSTPSYGRHSAKKAGSVMAEYMQDPSLMPQNGTRHTPSSTNRPSTPARMGTSKTPDSAESDGLDSQPQTRPTTLPEKLNGPCTSHHVSSELSADEFDGAADAYVRNGSSAQTPEEVPGKLDLKFHHTHLCEFHSDMWSINQHSVPLAQYGHYWSSVGGLLNEDEIAETDGIPHQNGDSVKHRVPKVSNIPLGENKLRDEDERAGAGMTPRASNMDQNGHPFHRGTNGVRDVRMKKTMFQNLSPYRN